MAEVDQILVRQLAEDDVVLLVDAVPGFRIVREVFNQVLVVKRPNLAQGVELGEHCVGELRKDVRVLNVRVDRLAAAQRERKKLRVQQSLS